MTACANKWIACERCGTAFRIKPSRKGGRFCSWPCRKNTEADFWAKIDRRGPDECWPWIGGRRVREYGGAWFEGKRQVASRVAFFLAHGRWPDNARHSCDNPPCCNPAHIIEGDQQANMDDKVARGRQSRGEALKQSKLTAETVRKIRGSPLDHEMAALAYGVDSSTICRIRNRRTWRHVT
jgi:HNH endonuclease